MSARPLPQTSMVRQRRPRPYPARPFQGPWRDPACRHTSGLCLAPLGGIPPSSARARTFRRLQGEGSSPNFQGCRSSNGHGLPAQPNYRLRFRRQQSRSRSEQLVFSLRGLAGSHIHRYQSMTVWVGHSCSTTESTRRGFAATALTHKSKRSARGVRNKNQAQGAGSAPCSPCARELSPAYGRAR